MNTIENPIIEEIKKISEPMIEKTISNEMKHVDDLLAECMNWIKQNNDFTQNKNTFFIPMRCKLAYEWLKSKGIRWATSYYSIITSSVDDNRYKYDELEPPKVFVNSSKFKRAKDLYEKQYRLWMYNKLEKSVSKYLTDVVKINNIRLNNSAKGFIIRADIIINGDQKKYETKCIPAGGYNIQCYHYRYLTKIN